MGSPYAERGALTDEAIAIMKELWTRADPRFAGKYYRFSGMPFSPKPRQRPHVPSVLGATAGLLSVAPFAWAMAGTRWPSRPRC